MKVVSTFPAILAVLFGAAMAANIDNELTQDGATTYCMGEKGSVGTLIFDSLEANVGRCSVGVTLTLTASEFYVNTPITVKWKATTNQGLTNAIFPNTIDAATKLPRAVTTSKLAVCTVGTNCATNVAGTPTGADGASTGDFAADGTKALETNTFTLATAGDYIIVGLVALPGDSSLSIAAEEYIAFKKISVLSADNATSSSTSGILDATSPSNSSNVTSAFGSGSKSIPDSTAKQGLKPDLKKTNVVSDSSTKTTDQTKEDPSDSIKSASTSSGSKGIGGSGIAIIVAVVACCIVGIAGFIFVARRRNQERMNANKAFGTNSSSMASDINDSNLSNDDGGGKIDLTYIANITARNNDMNTAANMMSEESVAIMSSAARESELKSSMHSLPKSSLDTDEYSDKASYGAVGFAGHANKDEYDAYRMSNISVLLPSTQSEASMSNFGDSIVSARQNKYLQPGDWDDSVSSHMDSRLNSVEQAELKARGFGSIGGLSAVSRLSEDDTSRLSEQNSDHDIGFSMSSRPTEDSRATVESRFTVDYRATEDSRISEDSRATGFSEAMHQSRLQSGMSAVDSYGFRTSRSSADSYSSGMSSYSREGSRISGFSVASSLDSPTGSSKY